MFRLYAILDKAVDAFGRVLTYRSDAEAVRELQSEMMARPDQPLRLHAKDYSLYFLGEYDDATGALTPRAEPQFVVSCVSLLPNGE